jgi:hypothetical protein
MSLFMSIGVELFVGELHFNGWREDESTRELKEQSCHLNFFSSSFEPFSVFDNFRCNLLSRVFLDRK